MGSRRRATATAALCVWAWCVTPASAFRGPIPSLLARSRAVPLHRHCGARGLCSQQKEPSNMASKGFNVLELTGAVVPQGALVKGVKTAWRLAWTTLMRELAPQSKDGDYVRPSYGFTGEIGTEAFPEEPNRYHLYAGAACPWCHRVELVRSVRGLQGYVSLTTVLDRPEEASRGGWVFTAASPDPVVGAKDLREVYDALTGGFRGRCTAPLLVDKVQKKVVSNESADLMRMLNQITPRTGGKAIDLCPPDKAQDIEALNDWIYNDVNNGVYKCGFATSQAAYDRASKDVSAGLDRLESILANSRFLLGGRLTEADLRLFPTILRYDTVYHNLFKCSGRRVADLPHLSAWLRDVYQIPGVAETCDMSAIHTSYYSQLFPLNPSGIVPTLPDQDFTRSHGRGSSDPESVFYFRV